jgi:agmatinase
LKIVALKRNIYRHFSIKAQTTMSKNEKISNYNPSGVGTEGSIYGLPFNFDESEIILLPVPWDVTVSYGYGTHAGPKAILDASQQVDLYDFDNPDGWEAGIFMLDISKDIENSCKQNRAKANEIIKYLEKGGKLEENPALMKNLQDVNTACEEMNKWVFDQTTALLSRNKMVGLVGGDHSTPLGYLQALSNKYPELGILQIDAHADLRHAYEGFTYSHASIMYNALQIPSIKKLVQVGVRDISHEEMELIDRSEGRIVSYFDPFLKEQMYMGRTWSELCEKIVKSLPEYVYISYDIDGLDPKLCPNTGTPVAGGMEVEMVNFLIGKLEENGHKIVGFDLVEVGNNEWDGNVAARVLYKLCNMAFLCK